MVRKSNFLLILLVFSAFFNCLDAASVYSISASVHDTESMAFEKHEGSGAFDSYLIQKLPFFPVKAVFEQLRKETGLKLKSRGEAHITVITPVEYTQILKTHINITQINEIAEKCGIQSAEFSTVCIGKGEKIFSGKPQFTFFIVVKSPALLKIREEIKRQFVKNGGSPEVFSAEHFYPHITVGFTKQDLHEQDGVIKDESSFFSKLQEE